MALIPLVCKGCGGAIQMDDSKENGFCMYCGNRFLVKDELTRIAIEHSGTVAVDRKAEVDNYLIQISHIITNMKNASRSGDLRNLKNDSANIFAKIYDIDALNEKAKTAKEEIERIYKWNYNQLIESEKKQDNKGCLKAVLIILGVAVVIGLLLGMCARLA